jgi:colicin import membrane protein
MTTLDVLAMPSSWGGDAIDPADPFRYGWRDVRQLQSDGSERWERMPLSLEDVLHPQLGDSYPQGSEHAAQRHYLANVFETRLAGDPTARVFCDLGIAWGDPELKVHSPDITVVFGVEPRDDWDIFDVAQTGVRPTLIVEVVSSLTVTLDRVVKLEEYDYAGVPFYVLVDLTMLPEPPMRRLVGYRRTPGGYRIMPPDEHDRLWLEPLNLWLGIADNRVVCYDRDGGAVPDYVTLSQQFADARRREAAQ